MVDALPTPARDILAALIGGDSPRTAEMLGAALGRVPRGGSWNTGIAVLRNNGVIEETPAGFVLSGVLCTEVDKVAGEPRDAKLTSRGYGEIPSDARANSSMWPISRSDAAAASSALRAAIADDNSARSSAQWTISTASSL